MKVNPNNMDWMSMYASLHKIRSQCVSITHSFTVTPTGISRKEKIKEFLDYVDSLSR